MELNGKSVSNFESISSEVIQCITTGQAWRYRMLPVGINADLIELIVDESTWDANQKEEIEILFGKHIHTLSLPHHKMTRLLSKYYRKTDTQSKQIQVVVNKAENFVNDLIAEAKSLGSSDIHIEVLEKTARVRIRIDGHLVEKYKFSHKDYPALVNKIKIKANLDISEKRLPQDGRISYNAHGLKFDIRVSVLPTLHGEKIVMRILSNDATNISIEKLGFDKEQKRNYLEGIKKPSGIMLISGPTGSGKTTTLYATLKLLNEEKRNIITIEDPIEYTLDGINQVQLKENIGLTFASTLRSFLRQDPDVIMVGEIRDGETAEIAIRAALTGHLVLSTIHTNSAWGTISRLIDMGVAPYLLSGTLNTSVAQRLVRKLCSECKTEAPLDQAQLPLNYKPVSELDRVYKPNGCIECHFTGYKGRRALYEVINIDKELAGCIKDSKDNISDLQKEKNISTLSQSAWELLKEGITSLEEVYPILLNSI